MLTQGDEVYGVGSIEKIYAEAWPEMTTVCLGTGAHYEWLRERGARVELVEGLAHFKLAGYMAAVTGLPRAWRQAKRDARAIHERLEGRGIKIIHTQWLPQQLIAGHMRRLGYKSVWQINNNTNRNRPFDAGRRLNVRLARWGADLLLPASDFIRANWEGSGVATQTIRNAAKARRDSAPNPGPAPPVRCLVAGRIAASKGHHVAVEAVLAARRAGHDVRLDIYGGPIDGNPYADQLRKTIAEAGADDVIQLKGFRTDLRELHDSYHLGLQCRIDPEPCSLWVCETHVDGLPLIASATGGTPELVDDGVTGLLVPAEDAPALAQALISLAADPERLAGMRQAAFQRGQQYFVTTRMLDQTLKAYNGLFS